MVPLLNEQQEPFPRLRVDVHCVVDGAFQHAHHLLNLRNFLLTYDLGKVPVDIVMKPVLIPDDGVVLIEFALHNHP